MRASCAWCCVERDDVQERVVFHPSRVLALCPDCQPDDWFDHDGDDPT